MRRPDAGSGVCQEYTEHLSLIGSILPEDCRDGDDVAGGKETDASSIRSSVLLLGHHTTAAGKYGGSHSVPYAIVILIEDTDVGLFMRRVLLLLCDVVVQGTTTYLPGT